MKLTENCVVIVAALAAASGAMASPITVVDFETVPALAAGPSVFGGPPETITVPNVATFTGGTVLGDATFFPAIIYATPPNVYGTTEGFGYSELLVIEVSPSYTATEVSFALFNGDGTQSYVATAFDGVNQVAQQTFTDVPSNNLSGYALVDLTAANITSVAVTPVGAPAFWDFVIDTVAFNESVESAAAPEPATFSMLGLAIISAALLRRRYLFTAWRSPHKY